MRGSEGSTVAVIDNWDDRIHSMKDLEDKVFGPKDTIQGAMGFGVGQLQYQGSNPHLRLLTAISKDLELVFTTDNLLYCNCPENGVRKLMLLRLTHVKCLLKKEYQSRGGTLKGAALDRQVSVYLQAMFHVISDKWRMQRREILENASRSEVIGAVPN